MSDTDEYEESVPSSPLANSSTKITLHSLSRILLLLLISWACLAPGASGQPRLGREARDAQQHEMQTQEYVNQGRQTRLFGLGGGCTKIHWDAYLR